MKIIDKNNNMVEFVRLRVGDTFRCVNGDLYIKTTTLYSCIEQRYNALCLNDNQFYNLHNASLVELIDCKLVVK